MSDVKLRISTKEKKGKKWKDVSDVDGNKYWYRFTGGDKANDNGDQVFIADDLLDVFLLTFNGSTKTKYRFTAPYEANDPKHQLNVVVDASGMFVTVADRCTAVCKRMIYGAFVSPVGKPDLQFLCDPRIYNQ